MLFFLKHRLESPASQEGDESAASSAALATDEAQADTSTATDESSAESSTAETSEQESERSFFDVINDAANGKTEDSDEDSEEDADAEDSDGKAEKEDADAEDADPAESEAEDEEREEDVPFHKHPRWQQMVKERNEYRDQLQDFQPKAEQYQQIERFMETENLSSQEVAQGFQIMALMKNDPAQALEQLRGHVENLQGFVGERLPDDLQEEVDEGFITSDRAREVARLRNQSQFNANRAAQTEQRSQQERQQQQAQAVQEQQRSAVDSWQEQTATRDADFKRKQPFVFRELALLATRTPPRNSQEAVALAEKAYKTVNEQMRAFAPRKPEIKPSSTSDRASANTAAPQPDSFMDAVMRAAETTR